MSSTFPNDFLWGAATASHQVEGGNVNNDFWEMEHRPNTFFTEPSGDACDSWHRWEEDLDIVAGLGLDTYRYAPPRACQCHPPHVRTLNGERPLLKHAEEKGRTPAPQPRSGQRFSLAQPMCAQHRHPPDPCRMSKFNAA